MHAVVFQQTREGCDERPVASLRHTLFAPSTGAGLKPDEELEEHVHRQAAALVRLGAGLWFEPTWLRINSVVEEPVRYLRPHAMRPSGTAR